MKHLGKRLLAAGLSAAMVLGSVGVISADNVTTSTTYSEGVVIDGSTGTNGWLSGTDNYLISETPVVVSFTMSNMFDSSCNWDNFCFETVATDDAAGITLRADNYGWNYGDNTTNVPGYVSSYDFSWTESDSNYYRTICTENTSVTLTAVQTSDKKVQFSIVWGDNAATETYYVTYPYGVPSDLYFHMCASSSSCVTINSVTYDEANKVTLVETDSTKLECGDYWLDFTEGILLSEDYDITVTFKNTSNSSAAYQWQAPYFVLYSNSMPMVTSGGCQSYSEYYVCRSDLWGWENEYDSYSYTRTTTADVSDWDAFVTALKAGVDCTLTASMSSGSVTIVFTVGDSTSTVTGTVDTSSDVYLSLTGESCTLSDISVTYALKSTEAISFLGGSLDMSGSDYATTGLRFGYTVKLPDGVDYEDVSATWYWGTDANDLTAFTPSPLKYVDNEDGTITTNLVITDIPSASYATTIYSQLVLTYELDGVTYTVTDDVQSRTVDDVAEAISKAEGASTAEKTYAAGILEN